MFETAGRNGCIRAISRDTRISQNQSGLRRVATASRAGSGTLCWLGAATRVSDTGAPQPSMSVGGWLTENHQRPVAARETAQQSSAEALQQEAHPAARPVAAATESGRGALDPAWGICQHNSALQRPLICDTPTPLIVRKELLRPGGSRRAEPALAVLAARLTAPCSAPRWPEPPLRDEEASGRAA